MVCSRCGGKSRHELGEIDPAGDYDTRALLCDDCHESYEERFDDWLVGSVSISAGTARASARASGFTSTPADDDQE